MKEKAPTQTSIETFLEILKSHALLIKILIFLVVISSGIYGYLIYQTNQLKKKCEGPETKTGLVTPSPTLNSEQRPTKKQKFQEPPQDWLNYTNSDVGFSFYYPPSIGLMSNELSIEEIEAVDQQYPIDIMVCIEPRHPDSTTRSPYEEKYQRVCRVISNDWGGFSEKESRYYFLIDSMRAKSATILSQYEVCDVRFDRILSFNKNYFHVEITVSADKNLVLPAINQYLKTDQENCFGQKVWDYKNQAPANYYQDLSRGNIEGISKEWFDSYEAIISTLQVF